MCAFTFRMHAFVVFKSFQWKMPLDTFTSSDWGRLTLTLQYCGCVHIAAGRVVADKARKFICELLLLSCGLLAAAMTLYLMEINFVCVCVLIILSETDNLLPTTSMYRWQFPIGFSLQIPSAHVALQFVSRPLGILKKHPRRSAPMFNRLSLSRLTISVWFRMLAVWSEVSR